MNDNNTHNPTLTEAVDFAFRSMLSGIHTALPGRIENYDHTQQRADVKPLLKREFPNGTVLSMPVITNVPVIFPRAGGALLHFPVAKGDTVLLVFSERSIDTWLSKGGEVEPKDPRMFHLSDAFAITGLYPFSDTSPAVNNDDVALIFNDERITIKANGDIEIGAESLKKLVTDEFKDLFNNHVHNVSVAGAPTAQTGVSSSPVSNAGSELIAVPPIPTTLYLLGEALNDSHLTSKVSAE